MATVEVVHRGGLVELPLSTLTFDTDIQCREGMRSETVAMYREDMLAGGTFPPMVVFYDGARRWVADGFHRGQAYREAGIEKVPVDERQGTKRDAILFAVGANASHGLRRTNKDKRRAVAMLLSDPEWSRWTDREVARLAGVSHPFVLSLRSQVVTVTTSPAQDEQATRKGADGKSYPAKRKPAPKPEPPRSEEAVSETEDQGKEEVGAERDAPDKEDLAEGMEAERQPEIFRVAKTAIATIWSKCPVDLRWKLKANIENHLAELAEEG